jgi:hypothetical protein
MSNRRTTWTVPLPEALREMALTETAYDEEEDAYPQGQLWNAVAAAVTDDMVLAVEDGQLVIKIDVATAAADALAGLDPED